MKYVNKNDNLERDNWRYIEISKINDKIIKNLVNNLKSDLSDDFFISFESLIKIGKKAEPIIESVINEKDDLGNFNKEILNFLLNYFKTNKIENNLVFQLYHPDFIVRARALMQIKERGISNKYLNYILPLTRDPDASVRWAVLNLLISLEQTHNPQIYNSLKSRLKNESNPIIQKKLKEFLHKN
ncbi:MAG: HEAT repeat domain-containing protein [Promethearchaeota archaeon]